MTDMKKLLKIVTESGEKARIDEGVNVSINVSGDSPCDVGEVLAKVTNLSNPRPVMPDMMPKPSSPPPMPMLKAIDIVGKGSGPEVPPAPPGDMAPPVAPESIGQSVMMPDPSEEPTGGPKTSSQVNVPEPDMDEGPNLDQYHSTRDPDASMGWDDDRDEDPDAFDNLRDEPGEDESLLDPSMGSAHGEEELEGAIGTAAGAALGSMTAGPVGAAIGGVAGDELTGEEEESEDVVMPKKKPDPTAPMGGKLTANSDLKSIHDRLREIDQMLKSKNEEFANQPDPKYSDIEYMTKDLAGGLNKPKKMFSRSAPGDSPMPVETVVRSEWEKFKLGE